jgi:SAM-dependent methyltransferase
LLQLDSAAIFQSNWSYRPHAAAGLGIENDQLFPIEECAACGFIYAGLLPGERFLQAIYDSVIDSDLARTNNFAPANLAWKMRYLSQLLELIPAQTEPVAVLDYGCGFGPGLQLLRSIPKIRAVGYETSDLRLQELEVRQLPATGDLGEVAVRGPYAAIILDNVLEHLPDPRASLARIRRACTGNAILFVSVPAISKRSIRRYQERSRVHEPLPMAINPWEHLNYFDLAHLDRLLHEFGFTPYRQANLPNWVNIGLRPSGSLTDRLMNSLASLSRLGQYVFSGDALRSVTGRFYRLTPDEQSQLPQANLNRHIPTSRAHTGSQTC